MNLQTIRTHEASLEGLNDVGIGDPQRQRRRVLVVDDEPGHRLMLRAILAERGWRVTEADSAAAALREMSRGQGADVAVLAMRLPDKDGLSLLAELRGLRPQMPVVMLTASSGGGTVEALRHGAFDCLSKPADADELEAVLEKTWHYGRLLHENARLKAREDSGPQLIGQSKAMRQLIELVDQVAQSEATVLILGEPGTGKELMAERLHVRSPRHEGPLVKVNCAALPPEVLEGELFGYQRGAFAGALSDKPGRFQAAHGGTLLLDEVAALPLPIQAKLLRALQERYVEPLGSAECVETDVRVVATADASLSDAVAAGRFRADLHYRLGVIELTVPPLRDRLEDLPFLAAHLLERLAEKNRRRVRSLSAEFLRALSAQPWPGNVRELETVLERALILSGSDALTPDLLPAHMQPGASVAAPPRAALKGAATPGISLEDAERSALVKALAAYGGHRERTAEALGISRRTLQYKLKKHGLIRR